LYEGCCSEAIGDTAQRPPAAVHIIFAVIMQKNQPPKRAGQLVEKRSSYAGGNGKVFGRAFFKKLVGVQRATPSGRAPQCAKRKGSKSPARVPRLCALGHKKCFFDKLKPAPKKGWFSSTRSPSPPDHTLHAVPPARRCSVFLQSSS